MEIVAYCNNSCCPSIIFNEKDLSQPLLIKDDHQGSIPLTLKDFDIFSRLIANIQKNDTFPTMVSDRGLHVHGYKTDKPYVSIWLIDMTGNTRSVKDISFEHWDVFTEAITEHYAVA